MARRKSEEEQGGSWMDTYGDMVTLILTFFVLLYSMSTMEKSKFQYIAQAFSSKGQVINTVVAGEEKVENPTGNLVEDAQLNSGETPENFEQLYQFLQEVVKEAGVADSVEVSKSPSSVYLQFRDNVFFGPNASVLLQEGKDILDKIGPGIKEIEADIMGLRVNGHTAEAAGSPVDDYSLSGQRAIEVSQYLRDQGHISANLISSAAFGKYHSIDTNDTEEGRRRNRRVEIVIMNKNADFTSPEVIKDLLTMEFGENAVYPTTSADGSPPVDPNEQPPETEPTDSSGNDGSSDTTDSGDSSMTDASSDGDTESVDAAETEDGTGTDTGTITTTGAGDETTAQTMPPAEPT